jgi:hypothetical protein
MKKIKRIKRPARKVRRINGPGIDKELSKVTVSNSQHKHH